MASANTVISNFNTTPYYDDYSENKNFHRVLFKPGLAVQARELTQLQTILQKQIERFGDHVFKEGTIVQGCEFTLENNIAYVKLRDDDPGGNLVSMAAFSSNCIVTGLTSNVRAKVVKSIAGAESTAPDYNTFLIKYITTGLTDKKVFDANETLVFKGADGGSGQQANTIATSPTGNGSIVFVSNGVIYSRGKFVKAEEQNLVLEKYSTTPSYKVGFRLRETTVDSDEDTTLLDNADGSFNYNAPGADRLKVKAFLDKRTLTATANDESFSTLLEVENGNVRVLRQDTVYDKLGREFANRTYEESGNYMLDQVNVNVKEHLDNGENFGKYSSGGTPAGSINKLAIGVEPGVAFIQGYRNEHTATEFLTIDKAIDTKQEEGLNITTNYGNYVLVKDMCGSFDPTTYAQVELRDTAHTGYENSLSDNSAPGSLIGYAKVRFVQYSNGNIGTSSCKWRMYLFDIDVFKANKSFRDTKSIYQNNSGSADAFANIVLSSGGFAVIKEPEFNRMVYDSGLGAVKQYTNSSNAKNASFTYRDKTTISFSTSGTGSLSIPAGHAGGSEEFPYGVGALNSTQKQDFIIVGTIAAYSAAGIGSDTFTASSSNTVTRTGSTDLTTVFNAGDHIYLPTASPTINRIVAVTTSTVELSAAVTVSGVTAKKAFPEGFIFDMTEDGTDGGGRSIVVNSTTQADIDLDETFIDVSGSTISLPCVVYYNNKRENAVPAAKTVRKNILVKLDLGGHPNGVSGPWGLGIPDVFKIQNVFLGKDYSVRNRDVTDQFDLITNQSDSMYKHSQLKLRDDAIITLESTDRIVVKLSHFKLDVSQGIGFFSVDSYTIDAQERTNQTSSIATPEIPIHEDYNLRDSLDFRPRHSLTAVDTTVISSATVNPANTSTVTVDGDGSFVPVADENFTTDAQFYLPRIDRVVIGKDGKKKVVKGVPAEFPRTPTEPVESMTVAVLNIAPYPSLSPENASQFERDDLSVGITPVFQKRYTMNDIQALEDRINNLEYYSSLNLLEKDANDLFISNASGNNRFKNGIFVDGFHGHDNADIDDSSHNIAVDSERGEIRPRFDIQNIDLTYSSGTNVRRRGRQVRLDVNNVTGTLSVGNQVFTGSSFGSAAATGTIRAIMSTSSTTKRLYLHLETGSFLATGTLKVKDATENTATITAVEYGDEGDLITLNYTHVQYANQPFASKVVNPTGQVSFNWIGELDLIPESDHWKDTTTLPAINNIVDLNSNLRKLQQQTGTTWNSWRTVKQSADYRISLHRVYNRDHGNAGRVHNYYNKIVGYKTFKDQVRTGIRRTVVPFETKQTIGQQELVTGIIPFIRSRQIKFAGTGMRPNTKVYPFFDEIDVSAHVAPANSSFANTAVLGSQLKTDSSGNVFGNFIIPNNDTLKFRTGDKSFRLADIQNIITDAGSETTSAEANYSATGKIVQVRNIEQTTRRYKLVNRKVSETRKITSIVPVCHNPYHGGGNDPVAQTFKIGDFERSSGNFDNNFGTGADGAFISCIDVFFKEKSPTAGIAVEIREVTNGMMTPNRVPFGYKRLLPSQVNVSNDSTAVTPFYFDSPVYLRGNKEYAFVVRPDNDNPDYRLWVAELGGTDVNSQALIDKQPAVGIMMVSANDRTYEARQKEDIKFRIWRAEFDTTVTGQVNFTNEADEYIRVAQQSGTLSVGEKVRGESLVKLSHLTSNSQLVALGDTVAFGSNTGTVRQIVTDNEASTSDAGVALVKIDFKGSVAAGSNLVFTDASSGTYYANTSTITANTQTGFAQYHSKSDSFVILNNSSGNFTSNTTNFNGFFKGQVSGVAVQAVSLQNFKYNLLSPQVSQLAYVDTNVTFTAQTCSNSYSLSSSYENIEMYENNIFTDQEKIIASRTNEVGNLSGEKSFQLRGAMTTSTSRLSPVVDIKNSKSLFAVRNIINNSGGINDGEWKDTGGNALARYISKEIVLSDNQDAEDLKVYLGAYRPQGTDIKVYARVKNGEDGERMDQKHYALMNNVLGSNNFSQLTNEDDFVDLEFAMPTTNTSSLGAFQNSANNNVVRYRNANNAIFDTFKSFNIKIVLTSSTGSNLVPRVKDLRAIALQQ